MLSSAVTQLRYAYSVLTGRRFNLGGMRRIVADLRQTLEEFGEPTTEAYEFLAGAGGTDPSVRRNIANTRIRKAVREASAKVPYYRDWFAGNFPQVADIDLDAFSDAVPVTSKSVVRSAPFAFVSSEAKPVLMAQTTGTSGMPVSIWFSRYELELLAAGSALSFMLLHGVRPHHVIANCVSSRATFNHITAQQWTALAGAAFIHIGVVDPRIALDRMATPIHIPGKEPQITDLLVAPSYLACLIREAENGGWTAGDFRLRNIYAGGEILTGALRLKAEQVFGATVLDGYAATEILPVSGLACSQQHLHFSPEYGHLEVLDPVSHRPVQPGEIGVLTATPYLPYRDSTILLRYETGDLVRPLTDGQPLTCELATMPATSLVMGRAGTGAGAMTRDLLEILQAEPGVTLPCRYAVSEGPSGSILHVVVERNSRSLFSRLEDQIARRDLGIAHLVLTEDHNDLPRPCLLRSDLREHSFEIFAHATDLEGSPL